MENLIIGIDLGTTNSVVAIIDENKQPITLEIEGNKLLPSVVSLSDGGFIVGQTAKNLMILEPTKTVASIKRKMGQDITVPIGSQALRPEEISALILKKIKQTVVKTFSLDEQQTIRAVVTVPAYFTEGQRDATKEAAELAGLQVERIINEPTAAALSFGLSKGDAATYAIYDFGGGTFDVSIIENNDGLVEVLASTGNNLLGGDDIDQCLADHLWNAFLENNNLPTSTKPAENEKARLIRTAERTKIQLSDTPSVTIKESFFTTIKGVSYHLETTIERTTFEALIEAFVQETIGHLQKAVSEANLSLNDIHSILLVGGSSKIPLVAQRIEEQLNIVPILVDLPDEAVAHGAAVQGAIIDGVDIDTILVDITPHTLGVATANINEYERFKFDIDSGLLATPLIPKNTPLPVKRTKRFSAVVPFQQKFHLKVFQGEQRYFDENKNIGETFLENPNPVEHGVVEVIFNLDINGLLKVTAVEVNTLQKIDVAFKSSRGKKTQSDKLSQLQVIDTVSEIDHALLKRADKLFANPALNEDDKADLTDLAERLKVALKDEPQEVEGIETELLDLLFYLENNL